MVKNINMKLGSKGKDVKQLQKMLQLTGATIKADGHWGGKTQAALEHFEFKTTGKKTGVYNINLMHLLRSRAGILNGCEVYLLDREQYVNQATQKRGVTLHYTASGGNPYNVVDYWNRDKRGRVGTHFVVGRSGKILQCIPLDFWGYHIATTRTGFSQSHSNNTNKRYIGIEICNWGYLEQRNGHFYHYADRTVVDSEAVKLDKPFRTYTHFHEFSTRQVEAVQWLLKELAKMFDFNYGQYDINDKWFDISWEALANRQVLTTHGNFEYGKVDLAPTPNAKKMIAL